MKVKVYIALKIYDNGFSGDVDVYVLKISKSREKVIQAIVKEERERLKDNIDEYDFDTKKEMNDFIKDELKELEEGIRADESYQCEYCEDLITYQIHEREFNDVEK